MYWLEKIIDNNFLHDLYFLKKNSNTEISILSIGREIWLSSLENNNHLLLDNILSESKIPKLRYMFLEFYENDTKYDEDLRIINNF